MIITSYENQGLKITRFKLTPFIKLEKITIIIGKLICKEATSNDLVKVSLIFKTKREKKLFYLKLD